jgi:probable F420-dependent oxidoreductase
MTKPDLGTYGAFGHHSLWQQLTPEQLREIEGLGYGAIWAGGSPAAELSWIEPLLEPTTKLQVATGIVNIWTADAGPVAESFHRIEKAYPGRFLLGIGVGHPEATAEYESPLAKMSGFFDGLDAAPQPVAREERAAAALGAKMLDLVAERSLGAHTYFVPPEHTRLAREQLGPDALIATEVAVVVETDVDAARQAARAYAKLYLGASNYRRNLRRLGFVDADIDGGGSDRLIDAVIPHGTAETIAETVRAHLDAGADHVCLQPVGHGHAPLADYRALAAALL